MLTVLLILLVAADATWSLECINRCLLTKIPFGEAIGNRTDECQRSTFPACNVIITVDFETKQYSASFGVAPEDLEAIFISLFQPLSYGFSRECSTDTDCVIREAQSRVDEVTRRPYNATAIYREIAVILTSPLAGDPIKCFNDAGSVATCSSGQTCNIEYDQIERKTRSRGCLFNVPGVSVNDSPSYTAFEVNCISDLCNTEETYEKVKGVLNKNNLVDADGRLNIAGAPDDC